MILGVSLLLGWNLVLNQPVAGYKVYYGSASGNYTNITTVGKTNQVSIPGFTLGQQYYFAVTTLGTNGLESAYSSELVYLVPDTNSYMTNFFTSTTLQLRYATNLLTGTNYNIGGSFVDTLGGNRAGVFRLSINSSNYVQALVSFDGMRSWGNYGTLFSNRFRAGVPLYVKLPSTRFVTGWYVQTNVPPDPTNWQSIVDTNLMKIFPL